MWRAQSSRTISRQHLPGSLSPPPRPVAPQALPQPAAAIFRTLWPCLLAVRSLTGRPAPSVHPPQGRSPIPRVRPHPAGLLIQTSPITAPPIQMHFSSMSKGRTVHQHALRHRRIENARSDKITSKLAFSLFHYLPLAVFLTFVPFLARFERNRRRTIPTSSSF